MSFKWPGVPSPRASIYEMADYAELRAWAEHQTSNLAIINTYERMDENDYSAGVPEDSEHESYLDDSFIELERRSLVYGSKYPYSINQSGNALSFNTDSTNINHILYLFLLLATRLNMKDDPIHANIDGTKLFEDVSAEIAKTYFGENSNSLVFSKGFSTFPEKIDNLSKRIGEGRGFKQNASISSFDDNLDIVVWIPFFDDRYGKFIAFGQCKTGTNYKDKFGILKPDAFCDKWIEDFCHEAPMRLFFVADSMSSDISWQENLRDAGLLFDRYRIVGTCENLNNSLFSQIIRWTNAAAYSTHLPTV